MRIGIKSALTLLVAASGSVGPRGSSGEVSRYAPQGRMRPVDLVVFDTADRVRSPERRREQREARRERRRARKRTGFR